jgi:hypothetical protein
MKDLKSKYRKLEVRVFAEIREQILKSKDYSTHIVGKCIKVNVFGYTELTLVNDQFTFLDSDGNHYSYFNGDCDLEDLIDILNNI